MRIAIVGVFPAGLSWRVVDAKWDGLHRPFRFLGDTGVWRLLTSAARDLG